MKLFKKGDKVRVTKEGNNASQFHSLGLGVYKLCNWEHLEFEIEGTIKLMDFVSTTGNTHAYALNYNGSLVGYVYSAALELVPEKKFYTIKLFNYTTGTWSEVDGVIDENLYKFIHFIDGNSYQLTWNDNSRSIYKGYYK